jgi:hypothetical protein
MKSFFVPCLPLRAEINTKGEESVTKVEMEERASERMAEVREGEGRFLREKGERVKGGGGAVVERSVKERAN